MNRAAEAGRPFQYIQEENIKRLVCMFMLRKEEPWVIALVANHLEPQVGRKMLNFLPADLQAQVALMGLTIGKISGEQLAAIDRSVQDHVDFVIGGMDRLGRELNAADYETRRSIIRYLKQERPSLYDELRKYYLVFEDLMTISDDTIQAIVKHFRADLLAIALRDAPAGLPDRFFSQMSSDAAAWLKDCIDNAAAATAVEIEEARFMTVEAVAALGIGLKT